MDIRKLDSSTMNKAAQELGRMARGKPKNYTPAERERRRAAMVALNAKRQAAKEQQHTIK